MPTWRGITYREGCDGDILIEQGKVLEEIRDQLRSQNGALWTIAAALTSMSQMQCATAREAMPSTRDYLDSGQMMRRWHADERG